MRRYDILFLICLLILQLSCSKEDFNYQRSGITADQVDTLVFNTSHYVLNADGQALLYYKLVPSYYADEEKSYMAAIPLSWFQQEDYSYWYEDGDGTEIEVFDDYLVLGKETPAKKIKVFARVFGEETRKIEVEVRRPWGIGVQEKVIPVVFHVFQYTGTTNTEFVIEEIHLTDRMNTLNNAFSRLISSGASAIDTKIRFEPAVTTPQGRQLSVPGMNKVKFGAQKLNPEDFSDFYTGDQFQWSDFLKYYGVDWDPQRYLNIWILPTGAENIPDYLPACIEQGVAPLKGLTMTEAAEGQVFNTVDCGIVMNYSTFNSEKLNAVIGRFLGLLPTSDAGGIIDGDSDYCSDTFVYNKKEEKQDSKNALNKPITYISDNIMDGSTQDITVTGEQAGRMHYVLEHVPTRKMWKATPAE